MSVIPRQRSVAVVKTIENGQLTNGNHGGEYAESQILYELAQWQTLKTFQKNNTQAG
jgi:hypothetical protein